MKGNLSPAKTLLPSYFSFIF